MARRVLHDRYFKQAKAEGYAARSAYKLIEIDDKKRLIPRGGRVLDLGCAPGSWLQVAGERVGPRGAVVGIDLQPVRVDAGPHVRTLVADAFAIDPAALLGDPPRLFDALLSDMAPNTSGHGDEFLSARLCERVLDLAPALLRPGGALLMKILEGEPTPAVVARTRTMFESAGTSKPAASRDVSRETFIWATGYRGPKE
jgi:23S rRNA (uridine2552-2'-O)-methyltransferase